MKPDVVTYTTLMKALIRVEKYDKVLTSLFVPIIPFLLCLLVDFFLIIVFLNRYHLFLKK